MARELGLTATHTSIRRTHLARLELLSIDLYGTLPSSGLRGYGEVDAATAEYLEKNIPELERMILDLVQMLQGSGGKRGG